MNAATIGSMSLALTNSTNYTFTSTDLVSLNVNGTLSTSGNATITSASNTTGKVTANINGNFAVGGALNTNLGTTWNVNSGGVLSVVGNFNGGGGATTNFTVASGGSATIGGIISYGSGNSVWSINVNGSLSTGGISTNSSADAANININGTASLGNVTIFRSSGSSTSATAAGLHVQSGTATANNVIISASNSAALLEVAGGQLTVNGTFNAGQANTTRRSTVFVDGGTLIDTNTAGLIIGQTSSANTASVASAAALIVSSGTCVLEKLTLAGALPSTSATPGTNNGTLTMTGGTLYLGSGGLVATSAAAVASASMASNYAISMNGGTVGAKATWSSAANMTLASGTPITFKTADANNNSFDIALSGSLSGAGGFTKTGGGKLSVTGTNSYSGATAVNQGTLLVDSNLSGSGVTVAAGAALTGGGTISPALLVNGMLSPGDGVGTMTEGGALTFGSGSQLSFDVGPTATAVDTDLVHFGSAADNLVGAGLATLALHGTIDYTKTYTIFDNTTTTGFSFGTITGYDSTDYVANFGASGNNSYTLSFTPTAAVPEPAALTLLSLGAVGLMARRRR
jgi:hypothetical protein